VEGLLWLVVLEVLVELAGVARHLAVLLLASAEPLIQALAAALVEVDLIAATVVPVLSSSVTSVRKKVLAALLLPVVVTPSIPSHRQELTQHDN